MLDNSLNLGDLSYFGLLKNYRTMVAILSVFMCIICMMFFEPLLTNHLISLDVEVYQIGFFFCCGTLSYCVFGPLVGYFARFVQEKRYLTQFALIITTISLACFGPSAILGFPQSITIMCIGLMLTGLAMSLAVVPIIPELIASTVEAQGITESS